jgi:uncharacterized protein DUF3551
MRCPIFTLGALFILIAIAANTTVAKAQNYPWCAQYSGSMAGSMNCGFTTHEQCMATVSGMGGFCVVNTQYQPPVSRPSHPQARQHRARKSS